MLKVYIFLEAIAFRDLVAGKLAASEKAWQRRAVDVPKARITTGCSGLDRVREM